MRSIKPFAVLLPPIAAIGVDPCAEPNMVADDLQTRVTQILQDVGKHPDSSSRLFDLVYGELRAIAQKRMAGERANHTLQATALVNEAYVRMLGGQEVQFENRAHFFSAAAEAMRRVLVDHARSRGALKRGGGAQALSLSGVFELANDETLSGMLAIHEALETLEREDPRAASVVRLRFFGGQDVDTTAEMLGVSKRTVIREWTYARARLFQLLNESAD